MAEECSTRHLPVASTYADAVLYLWVYDRELKDQPHRRIATSPHRRIAVAAALAPGTALRPPGRRLPEGVGPHRSASCNPATSGQTPV